MPEGYLERSFLINDQSSFPEFPIYELCCLMSLCPVVWLCTADANQILVSNAVHRRYHEKAQPTSHVPSPGHLGQVS